MDDFQKSVHVGLTLSKRLLHAPPPPQPRKWDPPSSSAAEEKGRRRNYIPTGPMAYAVVNNPNIVENADIRSYQPYVHGECTPPALIPLHMEAVTVEVECCGGVVDVAVVRLTGRWRVHCVDSAKCCDSRFALPLGDQGSVLGFEVEASSGSYLSQLVKVEDTSELDRFIKADNGGFLNPNIFTLKIPKVDGGSTISVVARWSQKLVYREGQLCLSLPFSFPAYVTPVRKLLCNEKILVTVNSGSRTEVLCHSATHPLKELRRQDDKFSFSYEGAATTWSKTDFEFSYSVSSSEIHGSLLVQTPSPSDFDQREMFACYLFPGYTQNIRVFRKRVVFLVDISGSMTGAPLENVKQAVLGSLSKFNRDDSFNIIAFNREAHVFSKSMELATEEALERASEWFSCNLVAEGDTDIMLPVKQALEMVSHESDSLSFIFLLTDGAVQNEREICNVVRNYCSSKEGSSSPRISTFGIGSYCNHYFLRMLAQIGRGHYDAAHDASSIALRLQRFLTASSSVLLSNIKVDCMNNLDSPMLYSAAVQDLSYDCPVILSGRYEGKLPESIEIHGTLADMSSFTTNLNIQKAKDIPIEKVYAQTHIDLLTAIAWFTGSKDVEKQVAEISVQTGFPSEYTRMILVKAQDNGQGPDFITILGKEAHDKSSLQKMVMHRELFPLQSLGVGFGDLKKTAGNFPPGVTVKTPDTTDKIVKAATGCCRQFLDRFCCMCFIQVVSKMSDRFVITLSQICIALSCCQCVDCCYDLCANCS
ncbi:hypothetical protein vseg_010256 [Gypsophila vaccaria]